MQSLALELPRTVESTRLRVLLPTDLARFAAYRADPAIAKFQSWGPMDHAAAESFLTETAAATHFKPGGWIQLAIADERTDELLGDVGLFLSVDGAHAELGFTLARSSQGRGHASRAAGLAIEQFLRLETVREVRAITDRLNHSSVAVLSRVGFVQTATRDAVFKGKPCVELLFTRSRGDA